MIRWSKEVLPDRSTPLVIGVVDDEELSKVLRVMFAEHQKRAEKARKAKPDTPEARPVQVRDLNAEELAADPTPATQSHVLYLGESVTKAHASQILAATRSSPTLTVSDRLEGISRPTTIELVLVDAKIKIAIRRYTLKDHDLSASSNLLTLATIIPDPEGEK